MIIWVQWRHQTYKHWNASSIDGLDIIFKNIKKCNFNGNFWIVHHLNWYILFFTPQGSASARQMTNQEGPGSVAQWQTRKKVKCTDGLCRTADSTAAFPLQTNIISPDTILLTALFYDFLSLYSWHLWHFVTPPWHFRDIMLRYLWNRGQNPGSEREKLQKELFSFSKNVQYGFPHKPVAMDWDPHLKGGSCWPDNIKYLCNLFLNI